MTSIARAERDALCDLLLLTGPEAPTLCGDWRTRELAGHLIVRDGRPDAAGGIAIPALAGRTENVMAQVTEGPWEDVVDRIRTGPPRWSPIRLGPLDSATNTIEFYVHHEDVRRAMPDWEPRSPEVERERALWGRLRPMSKMLLRKVPGRVRFECLHRGVTIGSLTHGRGDGPVLVVRGSAEELTLCAYGRDAQAKVEYVGDQADIAAFVGAPKGL